MIMNIFQAVLFCFFMIEQGIIEVKINEFWFWY